MKFKSVFTIGIVVAVLFGLNSCDQPASSGGSSNGEVVLNNGLDSVSYAIGIDIGQNLKKSGFDDINQYAIGQGFADAFSGVDPKIDPETANAYVMEYFNKARKKLTKENLEEAEEYLAENKDKKGVQTTESGLQYKIIEEGDGPVPSADDMVKVYYRGTLPDGTVFDSTRQDNPAQFRVNGVIKGWTEALQLMPVGSKWELYIHPDLAYGENPRQGGVIEPNNLLIFDIELLEIVKKK
ncbi:MAG: FKBP-type peptidyl-prolyl cis-trans isomerase [Bacteroidales bacterium]|nr:FKBP-type peptidyl-prolyl cis-trans isomerase [Bacteroidales bacterium]